MRFINRGNPVKIRIGEIGHSPYWKTIRTNEVIDLSLTQGLILGFEELKTTEGQLGDRKVETKQIEVPEYTNDSIFFKELNSIKGIGKKTAEDIVNFATKEKLIEMINSKYPLPFRDDIDIKLRKKYG